MKVAVAPALSILRSAEEFDGGLLNLALDRLPDYVTIVVAGCWEEILCGNSGIVNSYDQFSLLLRLNVIEVPPSKKAEYLHVNPDILVSYDPLERVETSQQLYALITYYQDARRIYVGARNSVEELLVSTDKNSLSVVNVDPYKKELLFYIESLQPKLVQLKHDYTERQVGDKTVTSFSAYDRNDQSYAQSLLIKAYEDYGGDVDDRTYLYTYDRKHKTFVEFRPSRNNTYHGMDIDIKRAKERAPEIVRKYNK